MNVNVWSIVHSLSSKEAVMANLSQLKVFETFVVTVHVYRTQGPNSSCNSSAPRSGITKKTMRSNHGLATDKRQTPAATHQRQDLGTRRRRRSPHCLIPIQTKHGLATYKRQTPAATHQRQEQGTRRRRWPLFCLIPIQKRRNSCSNYFIAAIFLKNSEKNGVG